MWEKMALRLFDQVIDKLLRRLTPWSLVDDWCSGGAKIGDCIYCGAINVCKGIIFEQLRGKFKELKSVPLRFNETEKIKTKNIKRIKMVTQRDYSFNCFYSPREIDCLPQSTIVRSERAIEGK